MFVERCGYYDNGRLRTWLPYKRSNDSSVLLHDVSKVPLLAEQEEKYFRTFYTGPRHVMDLDPYDNTPTEPGQDGGGSAQCVQAYFGLVEKYSNIHEDPCGMKMCTACQLSNSLLNTSKLTLRGAVLSFLIVQNFSI